MEEKIISILEGAELSWFTALLEGAYLKRYVVAFTDNEVWSIPLLAFQAMFYWTSYDNLTIGWRTNQQRQVVVDIGTSTDCLEEARKLQERYNQQAIRDTVKKREIY